jgi:hypothetical protein
MWHEETSSRIPEYVILRSDFEEAAERAAALEQAVEVRRKAAKRELVESIRGWISQYGMTVEEIVAELVVEKQEAGGFIDEACPGQHYSRGPFPKWMRDRMVELGFDPANKADRRAYKFEHMVRR